MKVSALIPTYNRRTQVLRAIDSILAQTVHVEEIIVVDDGSTDGTAEAIRSRYGSAVKLFRQENAGVSAARNRAIREARGEWVAFLDSDDVWYPAKIERQFEALAQFGDEFRVCFTDCAYEGNPEMNLSMFEETGFVDVPRFGSLGDAARYVLCGQGPCWIQSLLVLRSLLGEGDAFDQALVIQEDMDLVFRLTLKTRFCYVAEPLVGVDRTPARNLGLCKLYATREDQKYHCLQRLYGKWLTIPEVAGTEYERLIRDMLRSICYDSAECKFHDLRIGAALREIDRLRGIGDSYPLIIGTLWSRKIGKLRRSLAASERTATREAVG